MKPTPSYDHDCSDCTFLGGTEHIGDPLDVYECEAEGTLIARFGNGMEEYASMSSDLALRIAVEKPDSMWGHAVGVYQLAQAIRRNAMMTDAILNLFG